MFNQTEINTAIDNVIDGRIYCVSGTSGGWSYASDSVVFAKSNDYLYVTTDGWRDSNRRRVVIKNMRGLALLSMI